jgi:hypothetical protein
MVGVVLCPALETAAGFCFLANDLTVDLRPTDILRRQPIGS